MFIHLTDAIEACFHAIKHKGNVTFFISQFWLFFSQLIVRTVKYKLAIVT